MLPFILYVAAGALTAFHVYALWTAGISGVPHNILELISLLGSLCLIGSGYISVFRPARAAKLALVASLGMWCFYAPAMVATIRAERHDPLSTLRVAALPSAAVGFLTLITAYSAVVSFRMSQVGEAGTWLFPNGASRSVRTGVGVCSVAMVIGFAGWWGVQNIRRPSSKFLVPDGYVGWVRVEFQVAGVPAAPKQRGQPIFKIPSNGVLKTSSPEGYSRDGSEYYYDSDKGLHKLKADGRKGRFVWGRISGEETGSAGPRHYEEFFVGTEQQFKEMAGEKEIGPRPVAASPK